MKSSTIRYRAPEVDGQPMVGTILMGEGVRVRKGYRILGVRQSKSVLAGEGTVVWKLAVETMPKLAALAEIEAGAPYLTIEWEKRERKRP